MRREEFAAALARIRRAGGQLEALRQRLEADGTEEAFGGRTARQRIEAEAEKQELAMLEEAARAQPPPGKRHNPLWAWRKRSK